MPDRPRNHLSGMAVAFAAVGGWELLIASGLLDYSYLPAPHQIIYATASLVRDGELARDTAHTLGVALAAVPVWLTGIRVSAIIALLVALVTEMMIYRGGLGGGLIESLNALAPQRMWAYALTCAVLGFAMSAVLRHALERSLTSYGGQRPRIR